MSTRMTKEQADEVRARMIAALEEVGQGDKFRLFVNECLDPDCDCGWDVWWTLGAGMPEEDLIVLWRAYCTAQAPDMMCLACWLHQFRTQSGYRAFENCLVFGTLFVQDCGVAG